MYGGTLDFQCQHISNGNIKYPIGKSIFAVNLPLQLFPAIVANSDIKRLKSLHTFLKKCLYYMLVKFEQNSSGVSHSDGSCVLGRIHSDVSSNIPKKVYHIVTDNFVNLLHISYA